MIYRIFSAAFNFQFRWMSPPPGLLKFSTVLHEYPGVDNFAAFVTGLRGQEFQIETKVDVLTLGVAQALYEQYHLATSSFAGLVWADRDYTGANQVFLIRDVEPVRIQAIKFGLGGTTGFGIPSRATCEVRWRLRATELVA